MISAAATTFLRRRRMNRKVSIAASILFTAATAIAHITILNRPCDDWCTFNHHQFPITAIPAANLVEIRTANGDSVLIKLAALLPSRDTTQNYISKRLLGKTVTLLLESPKTRTADGQLLAYIFPSAGDNLNLDIVADGLARADTQQSSPLALQAFSAEYVAKKSGRGLWAGTPSAISKKFPKKTSPR